MNRLLRVLLLLSSLCAATAAQADKRIALSFDDVPRSKGAFYTPDQRAERLIHALRHAKVKQAAFFLNPARLAEADGQGGEARIAAYVAAGHVIANHTFSHKGLGLQSTAEFLADVDAAEAWLKDRPGRRPWMRFPYLHEGATDKAKRDAVRQGLAERGLRNGYVTADGSDWFLDDLVKKAAADGKEVDIEQLKRLYIRMHISSAEAQEDLARKALGRSPAHVMLMRETDVSAMFVEDLVVELRRHGWKIITIDEAYRDALRAALPDVANARGDLISAIAVEKKVQWPIWPMPIQANLAEAIFNQRIIKKAAAQ